MRYGIYEVLNEFKIGGKERGKIVEIQCSKCKWRKYILASRVKFLPQDCRNHKFFCKWKNERIRNIFNGMKSRCYNEEDNSYRWYGKKGIKVCDEWLENPLEFEKWALDNGYKDDLTIDRIDSCGNYCPENCRWITLEENSRRASAHYVNVDGIELSCRQWADKLGLSKNIINKMFKKYTEEQIKEFIRRREVYPNKTRKTNQSWMNVYGL